MPPKLAEEIKKRTAVVAETNRRRGRPKGSKNRPKTDAAKPMEEPPAPGPVPPPISSGENKTASGTLPPINPALLDWVSELPIVLAKDGAEAFIAKGKIDGLSTKELEAVHQAFRDWVAQLEINLGPGGQLITAYLVSFGAIGFQAVIARGLYEMERKAKEAAARKAANAPRQEGTATRAQHGEEGGKVISAEFVNEGAK